MLGILTLPTAALDCSQVWAGSSAVEHRTFNAMADGSIPSRLTTSSKYHRSPNPSEDVKPAVEISRPNHPRVQGPAFGGDRRQEIFPLRLSQIHQAKL